MARNPRSHIFLSYARSDGEALARDLHERLEKQENLTCWRDRLDLEGGESFWTQLEQGIDGARWVLIVLTPGALISQWTAKEWREARKRGIPICPVWSGTPQSLGSLLEHSKLPAGMQRSHIYTPFPANTEDQRRGQEEWQNLIAVLRTEKNVVRVPFMVSALPVGYIERPQEMAALLGRLLDDGRSPDVAVAAVLRGPGGMGKTTLARAVGHHDAVVDKFYDGILWATLGTQPRIVEVITDLCRALTGDEAQFAGVDAARSRLADLLNDRHCLLIVDDVWRASDLQPLLRLSPTCTCLVTTRVGDVARLANADARVDVSQLAAEQSVTLLNTAIPSESRLANRERCRRLAERLEHWPLLLRLAAGQIRARIEDYGDAPENALAWAESALTEEGSTAFDLSLGPDDFNDPQRRGQAFDASVGGSLRLLDSDGQRHSFYALGILPEDTPVPLATLQQLWGGSAYNVDKLARRLADLSLIELQLGGANVVRLHDHILSYTRHCLERQGTLEATHRQLLAAWTDAPASTDNYAWRWLCYHLDGAKEIERLRSVLLSYQSIERRLQSPAVGIDRLVEDYDLLKGDADGAVISRALRHSAYILVQHPELLSQQLLGRVRNASPMTAALVADARRSAASNTLLPKTLSLRRTDNLVRQVARHVSKVTSLLLTGKGYIVSGGEDGTVYRSDLGGGETRVLAHHDWAVSDLLLFSGDRLVSALRDGRIYAQSLEGGKPELLSNIAPPPAFQTSRLLRTEPDSLAFSVGGSVYWGSLEHREFRLVIHHEDSVMQLLSTADGGVISGGWDGSIYYWSPAGGEARLIDRVGDGITRMVLRADRSLFAAAGGHIFSWPLDGGERRVIGHHRDEVMQLQLTADGLLLSAGWDGCINLWSLDGSDPRTIGQIERGLSQLILVDEGRVISADMDGRLQCWPLEGRQPSLIGRHQGEVSQLALTADRRLISCAEDGLVCCWSIDVQETQDVSPMAGSMQQLLLTRDDQLVSGSLDGQISSWSLESGEEHLIGRHSGGIARLLITDAGHVVAGGYDGAVWCWLRGEGEARRIGRHRGMIEALVPTADGNVISAGSEGEIYRLSVNGSEPRLVGNEPDGIWSLRGTRDGCLVWKSLRNHDNELRAWRPEGDPQPVIIGMAVSEFLLTPEGHLICGGYDGRILYATLDGTEPRLIGRQESAISVLVLAGDGGLFSCGWDGSIYYWPLVGGEPRLIGREADKVTQLLLTGHGHLVSGAKDGHVRCWPLDPRLPGALFAADYSITALAHDQHRDMIIVGDAGGCVHFAEHKS